MKTHIQHKNRVFFSNFFFWKLCSKQKLEIFIFIKVAATDMRCFTRIKLSRSLVHKKNFSLIWQVVFKLGYLFC